MNALFHIVEILMLAWLISTARRSRRKELRIMATLEDIEAVVSAEETKIDSLIALTDALKAKVDEALAGVLTPAQQAKVDAIFAVVADNPDRIQTAIDKNTDE